MGYQLRRWLADRLPDTLSSGERLVALEIADQANDHTRRAWGDATLATILRRTGYADDKQLGKVLGKLAEHGVELRVPVRDAEGRPVRNKSGRIMYACNGHKREFHVPTEGECAALKVPQMGDLEAPPDGGPSPEAPPPGTEGPPDGGASDAEAPPPGPEAPPSGGPISPSLLQKSSPSSLSQSEASTQSADPPPVVEREIDLLIRRIMKDHKATNDEAAAILDAARRDGVRNPHAWASSEAGRADIDRRLTKLRQPDDGYRAWDDYEEVAPTYVEYTPSEFNPPRPTSGPMATFDHYDEDDIWK